MFSLRVHISKRTSYAPHMQIPFSAGFRIESIFPSTLENVNDVLHSEQYISKPIRMVAVHRVTLINCFIIDFRLKENFTLSRNRKKYGCPLNTKHVFHIPRIYSMI